VIKGVKFVTNSVRDQDRALEFYTKKLGMRVTPTARSTTTSGGSNSGIPRADTRVVLFTALVRTDDRRHHDITFVAEE
jgi:catechol 2,3-dioxygenase-like lactoylglutathione lyase family enzyme